MDWIVWETIDEIKMQIKITEKLIVQFEEEQKLYKDMYSTDNKFEVAKYSFWRGRIDGLKAQKVTLNELLKSIYDMLEEEAEEEDAYSEDLRELRGEH